MYPNAHKRGGVSRKLCAAVQWKLSPTGSFSACRSGTGIHSGGMLPHPLLDFLHRHLLALVQIPVTLHLELGQLLDVEFTHREYVNRRGLDGDLAGVND
jgi:hypothetical protein